MDTALRNSRLRQAAKWIREDGLTYDGEPLGFNMGDWLGKATLHTPDRGPRGDCQTVACIAGTIAVGANLPNKLYPQFDAAEWLGLDTYAAYELFTPAQFNWRDNYKRLGLRKGGGGVVYSSIPAELAARVLEDMADRNSARPDWNGVADRMDQENRMHADDQD